MMTVGEIWQDSYKDGIKYCPHCIDSNFYTCTPRPDDHKHCTLCGRELKTISKEDFGCECGYYDPNEPFYTHCPMCGKMLPGFPSRKAEDWGIERSEAVRINESRKTHKSVWKRFVEFLPLYHKVDGR